MNDDGTIKPISQWSKAWRMSVSTLDSVETDSTGRITKIRLPDKIKNLELIGKHISVNSWITSHDVKATLKADVQTISDLMDELSEGAN